MKNGNNRIEVKFAGLRNYVDGENAVAGECERMVNLRERRDAVAAVGRCMEVGELATSERLVAMHYVAGGRHLISAAGNTLYWHGTVASDGTVEPRGTVIAVATAEIGAVAAVGDFVVAATASGNVVVQYDASAGAYSQVDTSGMVPRLLLSPSGRHTFSDVVAASEFDNPVTHWQRPLPTADVERISANAADAYERLRRCAAVEGYLLQPVLARYAVRLWDDSYLWVSAPLLIGNGIQSMATVATAATDGSAFTGVNTATAQVQGYRVSVVVEEGTAAACDRLVKSVDILVCDEIDPVDYSSLVDYTCVRSTTGGTVAYSMGYEFPAADGTALLSRLLASERWCVAASIYDLAALREGRVNAVNCQPSANATDLPAGVHRYEIVIAGGDTVDAAVVERCVAASVRRYCHTAFCCHNRRLFAASGQTVLVNPWQPSQFWQGELTEGTCRIVAEASIKTGAAVTAVTVWQGVSPFVPEGLNALLSYPDSRAVSMTISVLPAAGGTTRRITVPLHSVPGRELACYADDGLQSLQLEDTGGDSLPVPLPVSATEPADGQVVEYEQGSPLAVARVHDVCGSTIRAIAAADYHSNDNIGTPLYLFADDGTYAMPYRVATSQYSPAVVVSRLAIDRRVAPVAGGEAVYFATVRGDVCRVSRYTVAVVWHGTAALSGGMAWNDAEGELWLLSGADEGGATVLMRSGRTYSRSDAAYCRLFHLSSVDAYAATSDGRLLDISREQQAGVVDVELLTYPIELASVAAVPARVVWRAFADDASLSFALNGETGASCHGMTLCRLKVKGRIAAPLVAKLVSPPVRTVRLSVAGTVPAGTVMRKADVEISKTIAF